MADDPNPLQNEGTPSNLPTPPRPLQKTHTSGSGRLGKPPGVLQKEHTSANLVGAIERHGMGAVIESAPTTEMRAELEAAGVALPAGDELRGLSGKLNEWLEGYRSKEGREHSHTWYNLFQEVCQHPLFMRALCTSERVLCPAYCDVRVCTLLCSTCSGVRTHRCMALVTGGRGPLGLYHV